MRAGIRAVLFDGEFFRQIPRAVQQAHKLHAVGDGPVKEDVVSGGIAAKTGDAEIRAQTPGLGVFGKHEELLLYGVDDAIGSGRIVVRDVQPNIVRVGFGKDCFENFGQSPSTFLGAGQAFTAALLDIGGAEDAG